MFQANVVLKADGLPERIMYFPLVNLIQESRIGKPKARRRAVAPWASHSLHAFGLSAGPLHEASDTFHLLGQALVGHPEPLPEGLGDVHGTVAHPDDRPGSDEERDSGFSHPPLDLLHVYRVEGDPEAPEGGASRLPRSPRSPPPLIWVYLIYFFSSSARSSGLLSGLLSGLVVSFLKFVIVFAD